MTLSLPSIVTGLSDADMVWLLSVGKLRTLQPGERLVEAGRPVNDLFFVLRGTLAVLLVDGGQVTTLTEGEVIGEMSFVDQRPPIVSVDATEKAEILGIARQVILDRFEREPVFAARFYRALALFLADRLRETTAAVRAPEEQEEAQATARETGARFQRLVAMLKGAVGP